MIKFRIKESPAGVRRALRHFLQVKQVWPCDCTSFPPSCSSLFEVRFHSDMIFCDDYTDTSDEAIDAFVREREMGRSVSG
jgi:hypothetical protein